MFVVCWKEIIERYVEYSDIATAITFNKAGGWFADMYFNGTSTNYMSYWAKYLKCKA